MKALHDDVMSSDHEGQDRSLTVKKNISLSFVFKFLAVVFSFALVPLTINYLNIEQYGIWITLLSLMTWINFFDIGLGQGIRNKLAEAYAVHDLENSKSYIATGFATVTLISFVLFIILLSISPFISWAKVFNTSSVDKSELMKLILVVGFFFLLNFILSISNSMYYAVQKASLVTLKSAIENLLAIVFIFFLIKLKTGSFLLLGVFYGLAMTIANMSLIAHFFLEHRDLLPTTQNIDKKKVGAIASLGIKFFIVQMAVLVIFTTDNIIITQVLGPEHVTPYNIVFKLFSVITIGHSIIVTPLWSAYSDAYKIGDMLWLRKTIRKLNVFMIPVILGVIALMCFARDIINIWVGKDVVFSQLLVVLMGIYTIIVVWNNIYAYFANGISAIKPQMFTGIIGALINIPISIYFAKQLEMGVSGVILGTIISLSLFAVVGPIQCRYILKKDVNNYEK